MLNGLTVLADASKKVPSLKYALGVAGVVSILAIIATLRVDLRLAGLGFCVLIVFMVAVLVFSKLASLPGQTFRLPALLLMWFSVLITIVVPTLIATSVFRDWPLKLKHFAEPESPAPSNTIGEALLRASNPAAADAVLDSAEIEIHRAATVRREQIAIELGVALATFRTNTDYAGPESQYRTVRTRMLRLLRLASTKRLREYVAVDAFAHANLESFDFHSSDLEYMVFDDAFLLWTDFTRADLTGASFKAAFLQGADFHGATVDGADFSNADWYNAFSFDVESLSPEQLRKVPACPANLSAFIASYDADYAISFSSSSDAFRQRLSARWAEAAKPGGDCERVAKAHQQSGT